MESEEDIYGDLPNYNLGDDLEKLSRQNKCLQEHIRSLEADMQKLCNKILEMKKVQNNLEKNISELYKTAKAEIDRKDRTIADLRKQLDDYLFRRTNAIPVKRVREDSPHSAPLINQEHKKIRYDEYKHRERHHSSDRYTRSRSNERRNNSYKDSRDRISSEHHKSSSYKSQRSSHDNIENRDNNSRPRDKRCDSETYSSSSSSKYASSLDRSAAGKSKSSEQKSYKENDKAPVKVINDLKKQESATSTAVKDQDKKIHKDSDKYKELPSTKLTIKDRKTELISTPDLIKCLEEDQNPPESKNTKPTPTETSKSSTVTEIKATNHLFKISQDKGNKAYNDTCKLLASVDSSLTVSLVKNEKMLDRQSGTNVIKSESFLPNSGVTISFTESSAKCNSRQQQLDMQTGQETHKIPVQLESNDDLVEEVNLEVTKMAQIPVEVSSRIVPNISKPSETNSETQVSKEGQKNAFNKEVKEAQVIYKTGDDRESSNITNHGPIKSAQITTHDKNSRTSKSLEVKEANLSHDKNACKPKVEITPNQLQVNRGTSPKSSQKKKTKIDEVTKKLFEKNEKRLLEMEKLSVKNSNVVVDKQASLSTNKADKESSRIKIIDDVLLKEATGEKLEGKSTETKREPSDNNRMKNAINTTQKTAKEGFLQAESCRDTKIIEESFKDSISRKCSEEKQAQVVKTSTTHTVGSVNNRNSVFKITNGDPKVKNTTQIEAEIAKKTPKVRRKSIHVTEFDSLMKQSEKEGKTVEAKTMYIETIVAENVVVCEAIATGENTNKSNNAKTKSSDKRPISRRKSIHVSGLVAKVANKLTSDAEKEISSKSYDKKAIMRSEGIELCNDVSLESGRVLRSATRKNTDITNSDSNSKIADIPIKPSGNQPTKNTNISPIRKVKTYTPKKKKAATNLNVSSKMLLDRVCVNLSHEGAIPELHIVEPQNALSQINNNNNVMTLQEAAKEPSVTSTPFCDKSSVNSMDLLSDDLNISSLDQSDIQADSEECMSKDNSSTSAQNACLNQSLKSISGKNNSLSSLLMSANNRKRRRCIITMID